VSLILHRERLVTVTDISSQSRSYNDVPEMPATDAAGTSDNKDLGESSLMLRHGEISVIDFRFCSIQQLSWAIHTGDSKYSIGSQGASGESSEGSVVISIYKHLRIESILQYVYIVKRCLRDPAGVPTLGHYRCPFEY
jgi:hypothetical protein